MAEQSRLHSSRCRRLIILHTNDRLLLVQNFHQYLQAPKNPVRLLPQEPLISRDVGLALRGIDYDGIHLADAGGKLHVGGEGGASHTHNPSLPDDIHKVSGAETGEVRPGSDLRGNRLLEVVGNDHREYRGAIGMGPGLHSLHSTGDRSMDRCAQARTITDFLPQVHMVSLGHQRLAGGSDVLGHGNYHGGRGWEGYNGLLPGQVLSVLGMDTAVKGKCHEYHHLFEKFEKNRQPQPGYRVCLLLLYCIVSCLSIVFSDFTIKIRIYRYNFVKNGQGCERAAAPVRIRRD